jgi:carboxymethylenebutenolidase
VKNIKAAMLMNYAENDPGVNGTRPGYEEALKAAGIPYEMFT